MKKIKIALLFNCIFLLIGFSFYNESLFGSDKKELDTNVLVSLKEKDNVSKESVQNNFYKNLKEIIGFNYRKIDTFDKVSNIVSLRINKNDINLIESLDEVSYVQEDIEYYFDPKDPTYSTYSENDVPDINYSLKTMNGLDVVTNGGANTIIAILDTSLNYNHDSFQPLDPSLTRYSSSDIASLASESTFNGKRFSYISSKIPFAYNYCNEDNDVISTQTHGTHVSSLALGNGRYKGIAPSAQLAFMKVFNDRGGGCTSSIYLKALEDCLTLKVDAINMSFGSTLTYYQDSTDKAVNEVISKLKENGTSVFVAAGNDGREYYKGSDYEYSPLENIESGDMGKLALDENVITVGSAYTHDTTSNVYGLVDNRSFLVSDKIVNSVAQNSEGEFIETKFDKEYRFYDFVNNNKNYEYVIVPNYGDKDDYAGLNVKGKIAVVDRGELPFLAKIYYAIQSGANGLLIANTSGGSSVGSFSFEVDDESYKNYPDLPIIIDENGKRVFDISVINIPVAMISYSSGCYLKESNNKIISFTQNELANSTSSGNGANLTLKPDIIAPGVDVFGALGYDSILKKYTNDSYYFISGTSMATPNLAGAYLSLISNTNLNASRRENSINLSKKMLSNTTLLLDNDGVYISPRKQGNGLVNINSTLNSKGYLFNTSNNESKIELYNSKDLQDGVIKTSVSLFEEVPQVYDVTLSIMCPKIQTQLINGKLYEVKNNDDVLLEKVSLGKVSSKVGDNEYDFTHSFSTKTTQYLSRFSNGTIVEGYITFSNNSQTLNIPYLGFYGDYSNVKPYEDFSFEKDSSKLYESDLMNKYISDEYGVSANYVQTGSYILKGEDEAYYKRNILDNTYSLTKQYELLDVAYDYEEGRYHIYTDDYKHDNGVLIQLFMTRNCLGSSIELVDENNEIVWSDYFYDSVLDSSIIHELYRNYVQAQSAVLVSNEYYTHRTYAYIPLEENNFEDGLYDLNFSFTLTDGSIYKSNYAIHLNEKYVSTPEVYNASLKNDILTIYVKDENSINVSSNIENYEINVETIDTGKYLFKVNLSSNTFNNYNELYFKIKNGEGNYYYYKYFINENAGVGGTIINENYILSYKIRNSSSYGLILYYLDENNEEVLVDLTKNAYFNFVNESTFTEIYAIDGSNKINVSYNSSSEDNELVRFTSRYSSFEILNEIDTSKLINKFIPIIVIVGVLSLSGTIAISTIYLINKKKRK